MVAAVVAGQLLDRSPRVTPSLEESPDVYPHTI